jgi:hypothetical protein
MDWGYKAYPALYMFSPGALVGIMGGIIDRGGFHPPPGENNNFGDNTGTEAGRAIGV